MLVTVYEDGAGEPLSVGVTVREVLGPDASYEEVHYVLDELRKTGRAWVGGGAAPLFLLMAAERVR